MLFDLLKSIKGLTIYLVCILLHYVRVTYIELLVRIKKRKQIV